MSVRGARDALLERIIGYAATEGIADRSLREIAAAVGTSHRMLLYHFGSREGLLAAIVASVEAQQRAGLARSIAARPAGPEIMSDLWAQVSDPALRPLVRLFFQVVGMAAGGTPGTGSLLPTLTGPWLAEAVEVAGRAGVPVDRTAVRLGVAVVRGLLLDLVAGADPAEVDAAHQLYTALMAAHLTPPASPTAAGPGPRVP